MADQPCKTCANYDPIKVAGKREAAHGWCAALSLYPAPGVRGRKVPHGAPQALEGQRAKPYIVEGGKIVKHCQRWRKK